MHALRLLRDAGMRKLNFAGGEPFLYPSFLGTLVDFCKVELGLDSVSIVSNGSKIKKAWLQKHAKNLDILAISCDSFDEATNVKIGRGQGEHISRVFEVAEWCRELGIMFKLNTVVCVHNWEEDMNEQVARLAPFRWKVFQVLLVAGENDSGGTKRDVRPLLISDAQYAAFCDRHRTQNGTRMVEEGNQVMAKSYLILDEQLRFLDRDGKGASGSVLEVGVQRALGQVTWDQQGF
jgi:radical S-adenosyl methionine domain-containing protein 2